MLPLHQSPILESADRFALSHVDFADQRITLFAMLTYGGSSRTRTHNTLITRYSFSRRALHLARLLPYLVRVGGLEPPMENPRD